MISGFLNPQVAAVPQGNDPFSLLQREVNRAFDGSCPGTWCSSGG